ncbi:TonB-dependent receptor [Dasania marina]|uniref:TonB-dependent receptor n=1 Tax=Dasania marina TaxID=471499 RepID=UPI00035DFDDF|nr:TonB-dependent receptor [Dasania marina]
MHYKKRLAAAITAAVAINCPISHAAVLEEVIVSAQKRNESLQDVPIAVAAFSQEELKKSGANAVQDLIEFVPGVELFDDRGAGQPTWVIRGVGLADFNSNNTPASAIYYDDFYLSSNVMGGIGLFDIERVEILKGPQGGLYGKNTSGGAILIHSQAPSLQDGNNGYLKASYGKWNSSTLEGAVGTALSDKVAIRLAATTHQGGGWQDSLATAKDDEWGDSDFSAYRAQLLFQANENVDVLFKIDGGYDRSETTLLYNQPVYDAVGDFCQAAINGKADEDSCFTFGNVLDPSLPLPSEQNKDGTKVLAPPTNELDNAWQALSMRINWDMDFATFTAITGYIDYENKQEFDFDAEAPNFLNEREGDAEIKSWSQEFRLTSNSSNKLEWLVGFTYAEDEISDNRKGDLTDFPFFQTSSERGFEQENKSWSTYVQLKYQLNDYLAANGSLRYTDEEKEIFNVFHYNVDPLNNFGGPSYFINNVKTDYELDNNYSGHLGLDWTPNEDVLVYGKITQGFKSGGFFGGFAFYESDVQPYKEERVLSYEVGFKSNWLDNTLRVNGDIFFYDYQEVQGFIIIESDVTNTQLSKLDNMGDAEHLGYELDIIWLPQAVEGLKLAGSFTWLNAKFTEADKTPVFDPAGNTQTLDGLDRTFAPDFSYTLQANYSWMLNDAYEAEAELGYNWRDDIVSKDSTISPLDHATKGQDGYGLLNARLSIADVEGRWELALAGKNLANEEYAARVTTDDVVTYPLVPGQPRSWSIEALYNW